MKMILQYTGIYNYLHIWGIYKPSKQQGGIGAAASMVRLWFKTEVLMQSIYTQVAEHGK